MIDSDRSLGCSRCGGAREEYKVGTGGGDWSRGKAGKKLMGIGLRFPYMQGTKRDDFERKILLKWNKWMGKNEKIIFFLGYHGIKYGI